MKTEYVCPHCGYHLPIGAYLRLSLLLDPFSFRELWPEMTAPNVLDFPGYEAKLAAQREKTALPDAAVAATRKAAGDPGYSSWPGCVRRAGQPLLHGQHGRGRG